MKMLFVLALSIGIFGFTPAKAFARTPLQTANNVDLARYSGDWYQIAHKPLFFEHGNCACARQRLAPQADGAVAVFNSCQDGAKLVTISGVARDLDPVNHAKLSVDFHLPFNGSYWIVALDPNYQWAIVSDKFKYSLYILARTPTVDAATYATAYAAAANQLNMSKVVMTPQTNCAYPQ